jgi:hypothetical protein
MVKKNSNNKLTKLSKKSFKDGKYLSSVYLCECGTHKILRNDHVDSNRIKSCGCLVDKHNQTHSLTYKSWSAMMGRCGENPDAHHKKYYKDRGIKVCTEWKTFSTFFNDMGERPSDCTLDRIDNNLGYFKSNCRWANKETQSRNVRSNVMITYDNITMCMKDWAKVKNIQYLTLWNRLNSGMELEKALNSPVRKFTKKVKVNETT